MNKKVLAVVLLLVFGVTGGFLFWKHPSPPNHDSESTKIHLWEHHSQFVSLRVSAPGDSAAFANALDSIIPWISAFTARYKSNSALDSVIYNSKQFDTIPLDSEAYELFSFALRFREFSHGDIDVGIGNLLRAWKIGWNQESKVPTAKERAAFVEDLKTPFYTMDSLKHSMVIQKPAHHFALGAFLEGRIMAEIEKRLSKAGATTWLIDVSGDFSYQGKKPNGEPWVLGVKDPAKPEELLAVVRTDPTKQSFCTSGDYEQRFTDPKGKSHHHIIDPHTGESAQGKHSASVTTSIPWMNKNTLCTWFMILPLAQIREVIQESKGQIETMIVLDSNQIWISPGLRDRVDLLKPEYSIMD